MDHEAIVECETVLASSHEACRCPGNRLNDPSAFTYICSVIFRFALWWPETLRRL